MGSVIYRPTPEEICHPPHRPVPGNARAPACLQTVLLTLALLLSAWSPRLSAAERAATPPLAYAPAPVDNPLKGFVPYLRADPTFPHSLEWDYTPLAAVMTGPTNFHWAPFEAKLDAAAARGHAFIARFHLEWPGRSTAVPQYLLDAGLTLRRWTNTNTQPFPPAIDHTPDYEDPRLRAALTNFIHALGQRYDGDPRLGFLELGLLGSWGEWHTHPNTEWFASQAVQREVLDAFEAAFTRTRLLARYPAGPGNTRYADNSRRALGYHDDSFAWATVHTGRPGDAWFFETRLRTAGAIDKWRTQPVGGEVRPEVWKCLFDEPTCAPAGQDFDRCLAVTHASWLSNEGVFRGRIQGAARERALEAARRLGYELHVSGASLRLEAGRLAVELTVTNTGVAPFYYDWPVELGLSDPSGRLVASWPTPWRLSGIVPGEPATPWRFETPVTSLPAGTSQVVLRVPNPLPAGPPLRFANTAQDQHLPGWLTLGQVAAPARPNVLIVMLDDVGYGDLSCHGSPFVRTPHLDALHASAVRLTDFHVAPMCSPTRGQLLTGLDALRNGASVIASSRMMVRPEVPMAPRFFADAGYATGQFGKWHLGENPPHRPEDRGFQETLWFPMQEISAMADRWGNDYFDPVLRRNGGRHEQFAGYCTDIFFREAIAFMTREHTAGRPFFCYLPLNACHGPQWAPADLRRRIAAQFPDLAPGQVGYLAMLANADDNFGRLESFLRDRGLRENTVVVFLTDNGGYALVGRYNAGMRDGKSRLAEGGHRVACFVRWPAGGIDGGRDVPGLTQVQDLLPTLLDLCGIAPPSGTRLDGLSLAPALRGAAAVPDRTLIVQYGPPEPFRMTCVMRGRWRLLSDLKGPAAGGPELYDLATDPLQRTNLVGTRPDLARDLRAAYDTWWQGVEPFTRQRAAIALGQSGADTITLNTAEWRDNAMHGMDGLRRGVKRRGVWDVDVLRAGTYEFALRRWPEESGLRLREGAPPWTPRDTATPAHAGFPAGAALPLTTAHLRVGDQTRSQPVAEPDTVSRIHLDLPAGRTEIEAWFTGPDAKPLCPAFFLTVTAPH